MVTDSHRKPWYVVREEGPFKKVEVDGGTKTDGTEGKTKGPKGVVSLSGPTGI